MAEFALSLSTNTKRWQRRRSRSNSIFLMNNNTARGQASSLCATLVHLLMSTFAFDKIAPSLPTMWNLCGNCIDLLLCSKLELDWRNERKKVREWVSEKELEQDQSPSTAGALCVSMTFECLSRPTSDRPSRTYCQAMVGMSLRQNLCSTHTILFGSCLIFYLTAGKCGEICSKSTKWKHLKLPKY